MKTVGLILLIGGLVCAVLIGLFWPENPWLPWVVGVSGTLVGILNIGPKEPALPTVVGLIGLTLALFVIETQWYNTPSLGAWLNHVLLYLRVFVSHALLGAGALAFLHVAWPKD